MKPRAPLGLPIAWWVALGTMFGMALGFSAVTSTIYGQFIPSLSAAFGWSRGETAFAVSFANIPLLLMAPMFGLLVDRFGAWRTLVFSQLALPLIFMSLALLQGSLTQLYISFFLITLLGAGTLPGSYTRIILAWFDTRRGLGMGIAMSGVGVSALVLPPVTQGLIALFGWRVAIAAVGGILLVAGMSNCVTLMRLRPRGPEEIDGGIALAPPIVGIDGLSWREAIATTNFWLIAVAFIPLGVASMGLLVNLPSILSDQGWKQGNAALIFSLLGATMIAARLIGGGLLDRWPTVYVVMAIFASPVVGFLLLAYQSDSVSTALAIFLIAFGIGAEFDVMAYLISRFFGRISYGVLYGCVYAAYNVGVAIGPVWLAHQFDVSGTYQGALIVFGTLFLGSGLLITFVARRMPRPAAHRLLTA